VDPLPHGPDSANAAPLRLEGAVTFALASSLKEVACRQLRGGADLTVSCARLEQIDATGVQLLLALKRDLAQAGRRLELQEVPAQLERTFLLAGLLPLPRAPEAELSTKASGER